MANRSAGGCRVARGPDDPRAVASGVHADSGTISGARSSMRARSCIRRREPRKSWMESLSESVRPPRVEREVLYADRSPAVPHVG